MGHILFVMNIHSRFQIGRDNQIASLENQLKTLTNGAKELQTSLQHKENGIAQLKSQLEYQCLGQNFKLIPGCINKNCS